VRRLWICPDCGRPFARVRQSHACGLSDLSSHLRGRPGDVVETFERFRQEVLRSGPATLLPERTRIAFHTRMSFAVAVPGATALGGHLVLPVTVRSKRFRRIERVGHRTVVHTFRWARPEEVDEQVSGWIARSYLVGLQRHLPHRDPPVIRARRLDLAPITPEAMVALRRGDRGAAERALGAPIPPEWAPGGGSAEAPEDWSWLRFPLAEYAQDPAALQWTARALILRGRRRRVVGNAGFHGRPGADGVPEIGYQVAPADRGRGYATEAVGALVEWAAREHGSRRVRAGVDPDNAASLRVVGDLGFRRVGTRSGETGGEELVLELRTPTAFRPSPAARARPLR